LAPRALYRSLHEWCCRCTRRVGTKSISRNTQAAQAEAGVRLARFVRGGHARYPNAHHFIIGHSHGGGVAL
jgi:hypothetical protein